MDLELKKFIYHKNGWNLPILSTENKSKKRSKSGNLVLIEGGKETILECNKPFALLQYLKKNKYGYITNRKSLKIKYL